MYNVAVIARASVDDATAALADLEQAADEARCTIEEYTIVRTDDEISVVGRAVADSDEDIDGFDGMVEALAEAGADCCGCDEDQADDVDEVVVAVADVFEANGAALLMLIDAPHQDDINAMLAPYDGSVITWDAADVRRALHEIRKEDREAKHAERAIDREEARVERRVAREEDHEARRAQREARKEAREEERADRAAAREIEHETRDLL